MILYHGTSSAYLDAILKRGIQPGSSTGNGNWEGKIKAKKGFVYLSDIYPFYYAFPATKKPHDLLILKLNIEDESRLYPDEDFIARCLKRDIESFHDMELEEINAHVCLEAFKRYAMHSYKANGIVAYKGTISYDCIIDHIRVPLEGYTSEILALGVDSVPIELNHHFMGHAYIRALDVLFETRDVTKAAEVRMRAMYPSDEAYNEIQNMMKQLTKKEC